MKHRGSGSDARGPSPRKIFLFALFCAVTVPVFITFTLSLGKDSASAKERERKENAALRLHRKKLQRARYSALKKLALQDAVRSLRLALRNRNGSWNAADGGAGGKGCVSGLEGVGAQPESLILAVTPTYARAWQAAHMVQVVNILRLVPPPLLWIVVESENKTEETRLLLEKTAGKCMTSGTSRRPFKIDYIHISTGVPHGPTFISRGVEQRNMALELIESERLDGIVYFMDDDNVYTMELFQEIRKVRRIGILPVGFLWSAEAGIVRPRKQTHPFVERPLVQRFRRRSHVFGWETFQWAFGKYSRKFHVDMAGMVFRSNMLWEKPNRLTGRPTHPVRFHAKSGYLETQFIDRLVDSELDLEPLANDCQDVLVWHTHAETRISDPYPLNWHLPQPGRLVRDKDPTSKSPYWIKRMRYSVRGYNGIIPFGYKSGVNASKVNPVSPDEVDKALNFGLTLDSSTSESTDSEDVKPSVVSENKGRVEAERNGPSENDETDDGSSSSNLQGVEKDTDPHKSREYMTKMKDFEDPKASKKAELYDSNPELETPSKLNKLWNLFNSEDGDSQQTDSHPKVEADEFPD